MGRLGTGVLHGCVRQIDQEQHAVVALTASEGGRAQRFGHSPVGSAPFLKSTALCKIFIKVTEHENWNSWRNPRAGKTRGQRARSGRKAHPTGLFGRGGVGGGRCSPRRRRQLPRGWC